MNKDRPICPICKIRKKHRNKSASTCYQCFSKLVKDGNWYNWVMNRIIPN
jgi:hypothetical protein